jgi:hypothetical protein
MQCGKRPLAKGEWKSRVASKIHFILAGPKPLQLHDIISSGLWSEVKKLTLYRCYTYTNLDRRDKEISKFADNIVFFNL